jgi:hypothetical protein
MTLRSRAHRTSDALLAIPSTSDRPGDLRRALDFGLDFAPYYRALKEFLGALKP